MKKIIIPALLSVALGACDQADTGTVLTCGNYNVAMQISEDGTHLGATINGRTFDFILAQSASGAKYDGVINDNDVTFWNKGDAWTMFVNEDMIFECK